MKKVEVAEESKEDLILEREKDLVNKLTKSLDLASYIIRDYVDAEVELIPGHLKVTYRSPYGEEVFNTESEIKELAKAEEPFDEYHYRIFRSLAVSMQEINGEKWMPGASIPIRMEGLKKKPKHLLDRFFWGHLIFNEALRKLVEDPEALEEQVKKS